MKRILFLLLISLICISLSSCSKRKIAKSIETDMVYGFYLKAEILSHLKNDINEIFEIKVDVYEYNPDIVVTNFSITGKDFIIYAPDGNKYNDYYEIAAENFSHIDDSNSLIYSEIFKFQYVGNEIEKISYIDFSSGSYSTREGYGCTGNGVEIYYKIANNNIKLSTSRISSSKDKSLKNLLMNLGPLIYSLVIIIITIIITIIIIKYKRKKVKKIDD